MRCRRFEADFPKTFDAAAEILWTTTFRPAARQLGEMLPRKLVTTFSPSLRRLFALADEGVSSLKAYQTSVPKSDNNNSSSSSPVIFDSLHHLPDEAVALEATNFLIAGSDTTAFTLASGVWHICRNPTVKRKLATALKAASPEQQREGDYPTLLALESIPYLIACVKESLRIAMPVPGRLPRVVPPITTTTTPPLIVDEKVVPPGCTVGMSAYTMHTSSELWGPNALHFEPERWLGEGARGLDENLVAFSKGARNCVGQTLAHAELLFVLYMLFRHFDVELDGASEVGFVTKDNFTQSVRGAGVLLRLRRL